MKVDYERWRGFFFQAIKDNTDSRHALFLCHIKKKKFLLILYRLVEKFKDGFFGPIIGLSFYLVTYLFIRFPQNRKCVSMVQLKTEKKSYRDIFLKNHNEINLIYTGLSGLFSPVTFLFRSFSFRKIYHDFCILGKILKRYDLFIALRLVQYLAYYDRFNFEIDQKNCKTIIMFTDSNPHGSALMHLAHKKDIWSCFISHGEPDKPVLPIYCDVVYLLGERSLFRYKNSKSRFKKVLYQGHKDIFKKMRIIEFSQNLCIGIFLGQLTNLEAVLELTFLLEKVFKCGTILIRRHPNMGLLKREKKNFLKNPKIRISDGKSIDTDIEKCDLIFASNTTVHVDVLLRGRPSLYYRNLEKDFFDKYGYVRERIILDWNADMTPDEINDFYQDLNKKNRINYYCNIERDSHESNKKINEIIFK